MPFSKQELQAGFRIGDCRIEPLKNLIVRGGIESHLERRVMDVLVSLAARAGEVVSRDVLNQEVWTNIVVTDQAVTNCISELRQHLGDDRAANRIIETIPKRGYRLAVPVSLSPDAATPLPARKPVLIVAGLLALGAVVAGLAWWWNRAPAPALASVAVLQFENAAGDESLDYLALALPDEVATLLTKSPDLAVRPIGYVTGDDPVSAARARGVDHIVSGRYYLEDDHRMSLAIEAQHVTQERVVWRTRVTVPAGDLLAMRGRIAESVQQGLLPALGTSADPGAVSPPVNAEAYRLYLRSLALPQEPTQPTERAIELLEQAVTLEPKFAPAWNLLGIRYYEYGTWGEGGEAARQKSLAAHRKALELDPGLLLAAQSIVTHRTETGDLEGAYHDARRLLERFGPGVETHFTLSYVYRYGGMLEASQRECEMARKIDSQDPRLRSCGYAYLYSGKLSRVMEYIRLDEGTFFYRWGALHYHLRMNEREAALHVVRQAAVEPTRGFMEPCLEGARGAVLDQAATEFVDHWGRSEDPEAAYAMAPFLAYCGRQEDALRFLERAVDNRFCSFPGLDQDPIWAPMRADADFQRIRAKGKACQEKFRSMVEAYDKSAT